jgi:hypothetical protein
MRHHYTTRSTFSGMSGQAQAALNTIWDRVEWVNRVIGERSCGCGTPATAIVSRGLLHSVGYYGPPLGKVSSAPSLRHLGHTAAWAFKLGAPTDTTQPVARMNRASSISVWPHSRIVPSSKRPIPQGAHTIRPSPPGWLPPPRARARYGPAFRLYAPLSLGKKPHGGGSVPGSDKQAALRGYRHALGREYGAGGIRVVGRGMTMNDLPLLCDQPVGEGHPARGVFEFSVVLLRLFPLTGYVCARGSNISIRRPVISSVTFETLA